MIILLTPLPPIRQPTMTKRLHYGGRYAPALTAFALFLIACAAPLAAQARDHSSEGNFSEIAAAMQRRVDSGPPPSIAIAVARRGKIVWEHAFGKSDIERQQIATVNTPYFIASISKTITATALWRLLHTKRWTSTGPSTPTSGACRSLAPCG